MEWYFGRSLSSSQNGSKKTEDREEKKTAKGVKKDVIKNVLKFDDYKAIYEKEIAMEENNAQFEEMTNLRSREHVVYTERQRKKCLSIYDNKRIWLSVNESVPIGHPDAPLPKETEKSLRKLRAPFKRRDMLSEKGFPMVNVRGKGSIIQYEEESLEDPDQPGPSTSQPIKRRHFGEEEEQSSSKCIRLSHPTVTFDYNPCPTCGMGKYNCICGFCDEQWDDLPDYL